MPRCRQSAFIGVILLGLILGAAAPAAARQPGSKLPPAAPTNLQVSAGAQGQVTLSWTDNANNEVGFRIARERKTGAESWGEPSGATVGANATTYQETPPPGIYRYRLRAYSARGNSSYTPKVEVTVAVSQTPSAPTGLTVADDGGGVARLLWTDTSNNETNFEIERQPAFSNSVQTVSANTVTFTDNTVGGTFAYRVRSVNASGKSQFTPWVRRAIRTPAGSAAPAAFQAAIPGPGFSGPTPDPAAVGDPQAPGYDAKAIARWDVIPYQSFTSDFNVGVVAFHMNGIDRVDFSANGGPWVSVREMQDNPQSGIREYTVRLRHSDFEAGDVELRAVAWPTIGEPRVLADLRLYVEQQIQQSPTIYVSQSGSNSGTGSLGNPVGPLLDRALDLVADGGTVIITEPGTYYVSDGSTRSERSNNRWITVQAAPTIHARDILVISPPGQSILRPRTQRLRWQGVGFDFSRFGQYDASPGRHVWFDRCFWTYNGWQNEGFNQPIVYWDGNPSRSYVTNSYAYDGVYGFSGVTLVRNSACERISGAPYVGSNMVLNCSIKDFNGQAGTSYHRDIFHLWGQGENYIYYGLKVLSGVEAQVINIETSYSATPEQMWKDVAFVNIDASQLTMVGRQTAQGWEPNWGGPQWSQLFGREEHILFKNVLMPTQRFVFDMANQYNGYTFLPRNMVFQNCGFHWATYDQYAVPGQWPAGLRFQNCYRASNPAF